MALLFSARHIRQRILSDEHAKRPALCGAGRLSKAYSLRANHPSKGGFDFF